MSHNEKPAAQQAESGAQAAVDVRDDLRRRFIARITAATSLGESAVWGLARMLLDDAVPTFAAQSQGAQALTADDLWEIQGALRAHGKVALSRKVADAASRAQQAAAPGSLAELVKLLSEGVDMVAALADSHKVHDANTVRWLGAAGTLVDTLGSAPGTPEAPKGCA